MKWQVAATRAMLKLQFRKFSLISTVTITMALVAVAQITGSFPQWHDPACKIWYLQIIRLCSSFFSPVAWRSLPALHAWRVSLLHHTWFMLSALLLGLTTHGHLRSQIPNECKIQLESEIMTHERVQEFTWMSAVRTMKTIQRIKALWFKFDKKQQPGQAQDNYMTYLNRWLRF